MCLGVGFGKISARCCGGIGGNRRSLSRIGRSLRSVSKRLRCIIFCLSIGNGAGFLGVHDPVSVCLGVGFGKISSRCCGGIGGNRRSMS